MGTIEITSPRYAARISPRGAALHSLTYYGAPLVVPFEQTTPLAYSGVVLAPWPNRLEDGTFTFDGVTYRAPINEAATNTALHGLVFSHDWQLIDDGVAPHAVSLQTVVAASEAWPSELVMRTDFELSDGGLLWRVTATNTGDRAAPYGVSVHPYLTCGEGLIDDCVVHLPAADVLLTNERLLPAELAAVRGTKFDLSLSESFGARSIDHAYTGLPDGTWEASFTRSGSTFYTVVSCDARWAQLYSGEEIGRLGAAFEPMTCPPNAFRTGTDIIRLEPGDTHTFELRIFARDH